VRTLGNVLGALAVAIVPVTALIAVAKYVSPGAAFGGLVVVLLVSLFVMDRRSGRAR